MIAEVRGAPYLAQAGTAGRKGNAVMANSLLLNPHTYDPAHLDDETRRLLRATVDFFENRGKKALIDSYIDRAWYADFLDFAAKEGLFATFLTPAADGGDDPPSAGTPRATPPSARSSASTASTTGTPGR